MSRAYAEQVMREHCTITWDKEGETIRDTTDEERIAMRAAQLEKTRKDESGPPILGMPQDLPNTKFIRPKTTKYRAPRAAYEDMVTPILGVQKCKWPRKNWPPTEAVNAAIASLECA